jgi:hypothetical protein
MPICPKCHKEISDRKFERHIRRCGESHKREAAPLSAPSATPSFYWGQYNSGYEGKREERAVTKKGHKKHISIFAVIAAVLVVLILIISRI